MTLKKFQGAKLIKKEERKKGKRQQAIDKRQKTI
jgi:hypothetical protein